MKVLLNLTTARDGGALQLAVSTFTEAMRDSDGQMEWCVAASPQARQQIQRLPAALWDPDCCAVFAETPARHAATRADILDFERRHAPNCVFSPYGPAYVRFRAPHLLGVALPWITNPSWLAYRTLRFPHEWIKMYVGNLYRARAFRLADRWWTETASAKRGMVRHLGLSPDRIAVIANTCGRHYLARRRDQEHPGDRPIRLLYFTAPYRHKHLEMLPRIASQLRRRQPGLAFRIVTTLPEDNVYYHRMMDVAERLDVTGLLENLGRIPIARGPDLYQDCHISLVPTLLEVFSATYPESMAMGLPIVTSDLDFARDVCQDAALYYPPKDAVAAADCILRLVNDPVTWHQLVRNGKHVLARFPTATEKYHAYKRILEQMADERVVATRAVQPTRST